MSTSEETRRGGRDGTGDGSGAARHGLDDDAFGLTGADDDEVVYEWVADDDPESAARTADRGMITRAGLREAVLRLRRDWRTVRRRGALALAVVLVTGGVSVGATTWFDTVARGADEATVADLALDAVLDGDPAAAKFDVDTTRGSAQFVLEVANNGPAPVTLVNLSVDAGTLMTSTAWRPIGSARIAPGATAGAALTVDVDCRLLSLGEAVSSGSASPAAFSFPDVHAAVRTADGEIRQVVLSSRKRVPLDSVTHSTDLADGQTPQVTMTSVGQCGDVLERQRQEFFDSQGFSGAIGGPPIDRDPEQITVTYTGVLKAATQSSPEYVLGFRAHNPAAVTMMSLSDPGNTGAPVTDLVTMTPGKSTIPAGGDADFTLTVKIATCHDGLSPEGADQYFVRTGPQYAADLRAVGEQFGSISHFLTGTGVQLTLDELAQRKAACP